MKEKFILKSRFTGNYFAGFELNGLEKVSIYSPSVFRAKKFTQTQLEKEKTAQRFCRLLDGPFGCDLIKI